MPVKNKGGRWGWTIVFLVAVAISAVAAVAVRHHWSRLITTDDIAILAAAFTLAATGLAYGAARESRDAASESRRALQLHFRPGGVWVDFKIRDPHDPQAQMPYTPLPVPAHLWVSLIFQSEVQDQYELVWIDDAGQSHPRTLNPIAGVEEHFRLDGIVGTEDRSEGPARIRAGRVRLILTCIDGHVGGKWTVARTWGAATDLDSCRLDFDPKE